MPVIDVEELIRRLDPQGVGANPVRPCRGCGVGEGELHHCNCPESPQVKLLRRAAELLKRTEWGTECLCPSCRAPFDGHYDGCEAEKLRADIRRALA